MTHWVWTPSAVLYLLHGTRRQANEERDDWPTGDELGTGSRSREIQG